MCNRIVKVNENEWGMIVKSLYNSRNDLVKKGAYSKELNKLILKVSNAPTTKEYAK